MPLVIGLFLISLCSVTLYGQVTYPLAVADSLQVRSSLNETDSLLQSHELEPVEIIARFNPEPILSLTASAQSILPLKLEIHHPATLLPAINTVTGVRMEERSPGSYRVAMRGSLIRSPFGIRNIKIYLDEFPLTDAGGNTYLNLIDPASISAIHVLKGPDGSLYGANSGGVIRIEPKGFNILQNQTSLILTGGSYGLFSEQLSLQRNVTDKYSFSLDHSFIHSDGYRENTAMQKKTIQTAHKWVYSRSNQLRLLAFFTDLHYLTPGGLTERQMRENPQMARPSVGTTPSAVEQKAGIHNKTFFIGVAHEAVLSDRLSHLVSVVGSFTNYENPFITNYEIRKEKNFGIRTWFSYKDSINNNIRFQMEAGLEGQSGLYRIDNFENERGKATLPQAMDNLNNTVGSFFYRASFTFFRKWTIESSVGLNNARIRYDQVYPVTLKGRGNIAFGSILMPRIATSYMLLEDFAIRGSVSKGYSLPAIAEVRSSDNVINTELKPETGINYEAGIRVGNPNRKFYVDMSWYYYIMDNGIVRHLRENGAEYYVNAGQMKQKGMEVFFSARLLKFTEERWVRTLKFQTAITLNNYRFGKYVVSTDDFSGNKLTGVPDKILANTLIIRLPRQIHMNISHTFNSTIPLNDANTVFSAKYNLIQIKGHWNLAYRHTKQLQLFIGIDNLLNEKYSLGNDINAFGNRYYNPAPPTNYYAGVKVVI